MTHMSPDAPTSEQPDLRVAACQLLTGPDVDANADRIIECMGRAKTRQVDIIAFPEAAICGYCCDAAYWNAARSEAFDAAEARIIEASKHLDIAVALGTAHWDNGNIYNDILAIDKGGVVRGRYSKTHLAEQWPQPGTHIPIYDLCGVRTCFIICHDIRYPELVRLPAIGGAQICVFCTNESGLTAEFKLTAYRAMPIARAAENGIYLVMANAPANADDLHSPSQSHGNSKIIDPGGNVLTEAGHFEETLQVSSIDLSKATGAWARRSVEDDTILREWMKQGAEIVTHPTPG